MEVNKVFYSIFLLGVCFWQYPAVYWAGSVFRTRLMIERDLGALTAGEDIQLQGRIAWHLKMLISGAEWESIFPTVRSFCLFSVILSAASIVLLQLVLGCNTAVLWGITVGLIPYALMQSRLHERRVARSKEGDVLVQELLNNYRIYDFNMQEAIEKTALSLEGAPLGKKQYLQLAKGLQQAVTRQEVEQKLSAFRYAFDTVWANVLASNIFFGYLYGIRVDASLKDLHYCMVQSRKSAEYGRRENHEAKLMLLFLAPASFLLSVFFACRYFDFTLGKFLRYQFGTALGIQWFLSMVFCYICGLLVQRFFAKEKMDL